MSTNIIQDKYMKFTFGEFESEQFNTYIVRNGEKLSFFNEDNRGVEQFSTSNKNYVYYGGASYGVKSKEVSMMAICNSRDEFKTIMKYLETGKREFLTFGYEPNWSYDAVITKVSAATFHDDGKELLVEWKVTFGLYGNGEAFWNAPNYYEFWDSSRIIDNKYGLPLIIDGTPDWVFYLFSQGNGYNYVNIYQNNVNGKYEISLNDKIYCSYSFSNSTKVRINGRAGTYRSDNGFLEELDENGYNEGMIYFTHNVFKSFGQISDDLLKDYDGCFLVSYDWVENVLIELIDTTLDNNRKYYYRNHDEWINVDYKVFTIVSPVKLTLSHFPSAWDWISIEKHNNF